MRGVRSRPGGQEQRGCRDESERIRQASDELGLPEGLQRRRERPIGHRRLGEMAGVVVEEDADEVVAAQHLERAGYVPALVRRPERARSVQDERDRKEQQQEAGTVAARPEFTQRLRTKATHGRAPLPTRGRPGIGPTDGPIMA
jgi:hypothetical protein